MPVTKGPLWGALFCLLALLMFGVARAIKTVWVPVWAVGWFTTIVDVLVVPVLPGRLHWGTLRTLGDGLLFATLLPIGVRLINVARRASVAKLDEVLAKDDRPPVLYLRPFVSDKETSRVDSKFITNSMIKIRTEEELLAEVLSKIGPCVAIGQPDEVLPKIGFHRTYTGDEWRETVLSFMSRARLVVMMGGTTDNFRWELQRALRLVKPERLLMLVPYVGERDFLTMLQDELHVSFGQVPQGAIFRGNTFRALLYFEPDWTPHFADVPFPGFFRQPVVHEVKAQLQMALRPVYRQLNTRWAPPPVSWFRVLLMSGGAAASCRRPAVAGRLSFSSHLPMIVRQRLLRVAWFLMRTAIFGAPLTLAASTIAVILNFRVLAGLFLN